MKKLVLSLLLVILPTLALAQTPKHKVELSPKSKRTLSNVNKNWKQLKIKHKKK